MEKRNAQFRVTFRVTVLTWKTEYYPLRNAPKNVIGVVLGCLGGGDNHTNRGVFRVRSGGVKRRVYWGFGRF